VADLPLAVMQPKYSTSNYFHWLINVLGLSWIANTNCRKTVPYSSRTSSSSYMWWIMRRGILSNYICAYSLTPVSFPTYYQLLALLEISCQLASHNLAFPKFLFVQYLHILLIEVSEIVIYETSLSPMVLGKTSSRENRVTIIIYRSGSKFLFANFQIWKSYI
jgi:hypothetical protein